MPAVLLEVLLLLRAAVHGSARTSRPDHQFNRFGWSRSSGSESIKGFCMAALFHSDAVQRYKHIIFSKSSSIGSRTGRHSTHHVPAILPP